MHIVFGGAFNGKREFVRSRLEGRKISWYEGELPEADSSFAVFAGLEQWVKKQLEKGIKEQKILEIIQTAVSSGKDSRQIWILTDMNRGIVPVDPLERELRDVIGRLYQVLFAEAESVTRIWYGIPEILKGADEYENLYENGR